MRGSEAAAAACNGEARPENGPAGLWRKDPNAAPPLSLHLMHPLVVVAPDIRSAYNVGSIFRTADSAGVQHVYLAGFTPTPEHRGVAKTALGAQDAVGWSHSPDAAALLARLRSEGYTLAALEITLEAQPVTAIADTHWPLALVLGNEVHGVPPETLALCDLHLALPQYGAKASLNVSVAFGIAAYGLVERYRAGR